MEAVKKLVGEVMIVPTSEVCTCGRKCGALAFNGLDPYVVCGGCLKYVVECTCTSVIEELEALSHNDSNQGHGAPAEAPKYEFLSPAFLEAMNDIGRYGATKYGAASFTAKRLRGDRERDHRLTSTVIADHAREHFSMYLNHEAHDKFNDDIHQLAAVAFNAMMESFLAGLDEET